MVERFEAESHRELLFSHVLTAVEYATRRLDGNLRDEVVAELDRLLLREVDRGWFDRAPVVSLQAQARHLVRYRLKDALRTVNRAHRRMTPLDERVLPDLHASARPDESLEARQDQLLRARAAVDRLTPRQRLAYLAEVAPAWLTRADLEAARATPGEPVAVRADEDTLELLRGPEPDRAPRVVIVAWVLYDTAPWSPAARSQAEARAHALRRAKSHGRARVVQRSRANRDGACPTRRVNTVR